jgi:xanthine/uracil permease
MFRSTHIYILLSGLLNLGIGTYLILSKQKWRRVLQLIGSSFVLVAPPLLICAFFYEPSSRSLERPLTLPAMLLLLIGTLSHVLSTARRASIDRDSEMNSDHTLEPVQARRAGAGKYEQGD